MKDYSLIQTEQSTTASAPMNIPHGTAPSSPVNGDVWSTSAGFFARVNGVTVGPFGAGVGITGTDTGITAVGGGLLGAVIDTSLISAQIRGMCTGTYDYSGSDDWQLWVSPTPASGVFTLDVWIRVFGNTAPAPGDSVCAGAYPTLTGTGADFTAVGGTSTWTGSLVRGDMMTVAPTVNTAGVKWWALYIPARRTF